MPLGKGVRYRMVKMKGGGYERLAFKGNKVIETKNMKTGAMHTPAEFAADHARMMKKHGKRKLTMMGHK